MSLNSYIMLSSYHDELYFYHIMSLYISKKLKSKLQVAQNKVVRFILSLHCRHSVGFKEFRELDLLPIPMRVKQLRLNHVHNIVSQSCPSLSRF